MPHLDILMTALPITVVAAIVLFVIKEGLEFFRRRAADLRKGDAFRTMLARECELNHWTYKRLLETVEKIDEDFSSSGNPKYSINRRSSGDPRFRHSDNSSWPIPDAHTEIMNKVMLDVASLDKPLFEKLQAAYDAINEMKHVRESLINFVESDDETDKMIFENFPHYAKNELADTFRALEILYRECTGQDLTQHRLR